MSKYLYDKVSEVIHLFAPELPHSSRHCYGESSATVYNDASLPLYASPNYAVCYLSALYQLTAHSLSFAADPTPATTAVFSCKINSRLSILAGLLTSVHSLSIVCYTSITVLFSEPHRSTNSFLLLNLLGAPDVLTSSTSTGRSSLRRRLSSSTTLEY